jgi:DNA-binding NtrC family response regulator
MKCRAVAFNSLKAILKVPQVQGSMQPLTILVADDEDSIRSLVQHFLNAAGHAVVLVANAREAFEHLRRQSFDLVITDVLMPDGDGIDLITELKQVQPKARILAMSGGGRYLEGSDYLKLATGLGAHTAIMKPFSWDQLRAAIERAMAPLPAPGPRSDEPGDANSPAGAT